MEYHLGSLIDVLNKMSSWHNRASLADQIRVWSNTYLSASGWQILSDNELILNKPHPLPLDETFSHYSIYSFADNFPLHIVHFVKDSGYLLSHFWQYICDSGLWYVGMYIKNNFHDKNISIPHSLFSPVMPYQFCKNVLHAVTNF